MKEHMAGRKADGADVGANYMIKNQPKKNAAERKKAAGAMKKFSSNSKNYQ